MHSRISASSSTTSTTGGGGSSVGFGQTPIRMRFEYLPPETRFTAGREISRRRRFLWFICGLPPFQQKIDALRHFERLVRLLQGSVVAELFGPLRRLSLARCQDHVHAGPMLSYPLRKHEALRLDIDESYVNWPVRLQDGSGFLGIGPFVDRKPAFAQELGDYEPDDDLRFNDKNGVLGLGFGWNLDPTPLQDRLFLGEPCRSRLLGLSRSGLRSAPPQRDLATVCLDSYWMVRC